MALESVYDLPTKKGCAMGINYDDMTDKELVWLAYAGLPTDKERCFAILGDRYNGQSGILFELVWIGGCCIDKPHQHGDRFDKVCQALIALLPD